MSDNFFDVTKEIISGPIKIESIDKSAKVYCEIHGKTHINYNAFHSHKYARDAMKHPKGEETTFYEGNGRYIARTSLSAQEITAIRQALKEKKNMTSKKSLSSVTEEHSTSLAEKVSKNVCEDGSKCNKQPVPQTVLEAFRKAIFSMMKNDSADKSRVNELLEDNDLVIEMVHFCAFKVLAKFQLETNINEENIDILSERIREIDRVMTLCEKDGLFKSALDEDVAVLKNAKDCYEKKIGYLRAAEVLSLKRKRSEVSEVLEKKRTVAALSSIRDKSIETQTKHIKWISRYDDDDDDETQDEEQETNEN